MKAIRSCTLALLLAGVCIAPAYTRQSGGTCDATCLNGFVDQYLAALVARDPTRLAAAADIRFTENTRQLRLGDGLWATVTGIGPYKQYLADPTTGTAALYATILENDAPALFVLRLKVVERYIKEVETVVVRQQPMGRFLKTDATTVKPIWDETLAPPERRSRQQMIAAVDPYFEGLNRGNGDIVPFDDACNRTENGIQTTNNAPSGGPPMFPSHPQLNLGAMGCRAQFNTKLVTYIHEVKPRRYVLVDESKGLVFGFFMFRHPGNITSVDVPGVGAVPMMKAALYPFDVEVAELFKVKNGKIREIEAYMISLPYRSDTGWDR
jgi:hypothetical protein